MTEALPGLHHLRAHPGGPRGQRVIGSSVSWSGGSGLAELVLSRCLDLGMDFGGPAFSLSVVIVINECWLEISDSVRRDQQDTIA